nr:uncharacterized protein LOC109179941 [Ipomoea batatas]
MASSSKQPIDLATEYSAMSLGDDEEVEFSIEEGDNSDCPTKTPFILVGKLLTEKTTRFNFFRDTMATVWRPKKGMMAREVSSNLFLFYFVHELDIKKILNGDPWSFDQSLLLLKQIEPNTSPHGIHLNYADFWVQAYNIPPGNVEQNYSLDLRANGRRSQSNTAQRWLLPELPRRRTNEETPKSPFTSDDYPQQTDIPYEDSTFQNDQTSFQPPVMQSGAAHNINVPAPTHGKNLTQSDVLATDLFPTNILEQPNPDNFGAFSTNGLIRGLSIPSGAVGSNQGVVDYITPGAIAADENLIEVTMVN